MVIQHKLTHQTHGLEEFSSPLPSHTKFHRDAPSTKVMFTSVHPDIKRIQRYLHIFCLSHLLQQEQEALVQCIPKIL